MNKALIEQVHAVQASMLQSGEEHFSPSELDHLRCLIRLTIEFSYYLRREYIPPDGVDELRYVCDSIFSGVDSFGYVSAAYDALSGARSVSLEPTGECLEWVTAEFTARYLEFCEEVDFEKRCGLLLILLRLQIIFAGLSY